LPTVADRAAGAGEAASGGSGVSSPPSGAAPPGVLVAPLFFIRGAVHNRRLK